MNTHKVKAFPLQMRYVAQHKHGNCKFRYPVIS